MIDASTGGPAPDNADQIAYWNSAVGERWALLQARIDAVFAPLTTAALDFAAPDHGSTVLDIGCGSGATVMALAGLVGQSGRVIGVDVSVPMLAVASQRIAAEKTSQASVLLADAASHAFEPHGADLAFSRFGVMFFADPVAAFANIRPGLKAGGRLAFACWQPLTENPWFSAPMDAIRPLLPPSAPADPVAPGPFAFADPDRVRSILKAAGFEQIAIEPHRTAMRLGDVHAALDFVRQVGPVSRALSEAEPDRRPILLEALRAHLDALDGPDGVVLGGAIWLVSAVVPADG